MDRNLKNSLNKYDFKFSKSFGQNFISDKNLLDAICKDSEIDKTCDVLEIGTGAGTLTQAISEHARKIVSYEIDKSLIPVLQDKFQFTDNIELVFKDIMKEDNITISEKFPNGFQIVANIPYYITTPIIFKFVESGLNIKSITIMIQQEVAERLVAKEGTKDYGSLTVVLNAIADIKITRIVNRQMFTPMPNVDSAIVKITFNKNKFKIANQKKFASLVKCAFANRRKTFVNNLNSCLGYSKEQAKNLLTKAGVSTDIRGEELSIEKLIEISNLM